MLCCPYVFIRTHHSAVVGELDDDLEAGIQLSEVRAEPLGPVVY